MVWGFARKLLRLQRLRDVQKSLSQEVAAGLREKPTTGIQKHRVGEEDGSEYHGALGQSGTTIMMDARSVNTLFSTCAINGHGWLAYGCH